MRAKARGLLGSGGVPCRTILTYMNINPDHRNFLITAIGCLVIMALIATGNAPDF